MTDSLNDLSLFYFNQPFYRDDEIMDKEMVNTF